MTHDELLQAALRIAAALEANPSIDFPPDKVAERAVLIVKAVEARVRLESEPPATDG